MAAAVRKDGQIVSCKADPAEDVQEILFKNAEPLEKYDPDGYRYIYVVREYLEGAGAGSYTPVFGKLQTETSGAEENLRQSGDHFVYNTGVISNRYNETVTVEARKEWKAAAFQADFEDAAVELTLQSRPKGSEDDAWTDTDETLVMGNFRSEHLINTGAATVPKYDAEGHELEYRWEETGVYQNVDGETIGENAENLMGDGGAFTMTHTVDNTSGGADDPETVDRAIDYQATTESGSRGDGVYYTNVTNAPANKINYTIEKIWLDEDGNNVTDSKEPTDLTFYLYRSINGSPISEASIGRVTMDGQPDAQSTELELQTAPGETNLEQVMGDSYKYTQEISGHINQNWSAAIFKTLPAVYTNNSASGTQYIEYRIVEKSITYTLSGGEQTTVEAKVNDDSAAGTWTYAYTDDIMQPAYRKGASAYTSSDREVYNALKTTGLTVTKKWAEDEDNTYKTRPQTKQSGAD